MPQVTLADRGSELPPAGATRCPQCSQLVVAGSARCWRCGSSTLASESDPLVWQHLAAIVSVFSVLLLGVVGVGLRGGLQSPSELIAATSTPRATPHVQLARDASATPTAKEAVVVGNDEYLVVAGDDLFSVAAKTGVSRELLRHWNVELYPSIETTPSLEPGWILRLSGPPLPTTEPRPTTEPKPTDATADTAPLPGGASSAVPGARLVQLPILFVDVWNAAEEYYAISGATAAELGASMRSGVPASCLEYSGAAVACAGPATQDVEPTYIVNPATGACTLTGATVSVSYVATLPQWSAPPAVSAALLDWWTVVLEHIRWHEEQHVRIFTEQFARLPAMLAGAPCSDAEAIFAQLTNDMTAAQEAFHVQDASWAPPPYPGP